MRVEICFALKHALDRVAHRSCSFDAAVPCSLGDKNFALAGFFTVPASRAESDLFRQYFRQLREELCNRMVDIAYDDKGVQNKWWIAFSKRKFMNITSISV